ncbi:MAG: hypothetical protein WA908_07800 [Pontixanthobacter sp.]
MIDPSVADAFIARLDRRKTCGLLAPIIGVGAWILTENGMFGWLGFGLDYTEWPFPIALSLSIGFLALSAFALIRSLSSSAVIRIDATGIYARSIGGFVPWTNIAEAQVLNQKAGGLDNRFLMVNTIDRHQLDLSLWKRAVAVMNFWYVGYAHFIQIRLTNRSFTELIEAFRTFAPVPLSSNLLLG